MLFRADSGFCRHRTLGWCERHGVDYIVGLARNSVCNDSARVYKCRPPKLWRLRGVSRSSLGNSVTRQAVGSASAA
ncbi:transposase [Thalassobacterium sedimentorum]|uniref:transposase n=1 Tax=Thalassobacterium sedimentorum TaxID=3041258 RepID=UPI003CE47106